MFIYPQCMLSLPFLPKWPPGGTPATQAQGLVCRVLGRRHWVAPPEATGGPDMFLGELSVLMEGEKA